MTEAELQLILQQGEGPRIEFKIRDLLTAAGCPPPEYEFDGFFTVTFRRPPRWGDEAEVGANEKTPQVETESGGQSGGQSSLRGRILQLLAESDMAKTELAHALGYTKRTRYLGDIMKRLTEEGLVSFTIPDKPNSRLQKYRPTDKGRRAIERGSEQ